MTFITDKFKGIDYFPNIEFHHIEFYVGNAKQSAEFYKSMFGFQDYAYSGPETGSRDKVSYIINKNKVFYILTTPLLSKHPATKWLSKHGDGVYNNSDYPGYDLDAEGDCADKDYLFGDQSIWWVFNEHLKNP